MSDHNAHVLDWKRHNALALMKQNRITPLLGGRAWNREGTVEATIARAMKRVGAKLRSVKP